MAVYYHRIYEVDPKFVEGGTYRFVPTGNGEMLIATYKGRKFFVKRDMHLRYPAKTDSPAVRDQKNRAVKAREDKQEKIRKLLNGLSYEKNFVVVEEANFGDSDLLFTTVTALVPDVYPKKTSFASVDQKTFVKMCYEMAKILQLIHSRGVIHGDLKEDNILVKQGTYQPYLIDFDTSYPAANIPPWDGIGGTDGYHSPEVLLYGSDEDAAPPSTITSAVDIFSLAMVMHRWWTGSFPSVDFEKPWTGAAVYLDKKVFIDKKFNVVIGSTFEVQLSALLWWMIAKDPAKRPTAQQVMDVLMDKLDVPDEFLYESDKDRFDIDLWSAHNLVAELLPISELKKRELKGFKRINDGSGSDGLKYRVKTKDGKEADLTIDMVIRSGYANRKDSETDAPWEEHFIEFVPADTIAQKGYAKIERVEQSYKKSYLVTTMGGRSFSKGCDWLIAEGLATPKKAHVEADTPWPEDGREYNTDVMARINIKTIKRIEVGGRSAYEATYTDDRKVVYPPKNLAVMGCFKK